MLKANFKSAFFITLVSTLILLTGCSSPEEKKAAQIEEALNLAEQGAGTEALAILETLAEQYPNDIKILQSMGRIYSNQGDPTMAAFFLEQAHLQSPADAELLYQAYQSLEAADQPAGQLLEKLAEQAPASMTPDLWIRLGQIRQSENKIQTALDAYLRGVDPDKTKPSPETAAAIGQLYAKVGNLSQAESWFERAADSDDPNALTALFGLLEINLRNKDWPGAEGVIDRLDKQFPGAVEASQWQQARQELIRWRNTQDRMKAELAAAEEARRAEAEAQTTGETEPSSDAVATETASIDDDANETTSDATDEAATDGKTEVVADLEAAETMANTPALEADPSDGQLNNAATEPGTVGADKAITFNPNIAIQPADPEITFSVDYDQAAGAGEASYSVNPIERATPTTRPEPIPEELLPVADNSPNFSSIPEPESAPAGVRPAERPQTIEELMADAETAELDRDFKSAIRKYWAAISIANNRADIWNLLSRAYLIDGQLNNAETTALEAVRLDPREVAYTLDYLRVAQRTKEPENFVSELETAYARFPASPEITLSLARAHERISQQTAVARNLYLRFVDIAPNHPLVPEARAAAARL